MLADRGAHDFLRPADYTMRMRLPIRRRHIVVNPSKRFIDPNKRSAQALDLVSGFSPIFIAQNTLIAAAQPFNDVGHSGSLDLMTRIASSKISCASRLWV
jgi:hypothetical protein